MPAFSLFTRAWLGFACASELCVCVFFVFDFGLCVCNLLVLELLCERHKSMAEHRPAAYAKRAT